MIVYLLVLPGTLYSISGNVSLERVLGDRFQKINQIEALVGDGADSYIIIHGLELLTSVREKYPRAVVVAIVNPSQEGLARSQGASVVYPSLDATVAYLKNRYDRYTAQNFRYKAKINKPRIRM